MSKQQLTELLIKDDKPYQHKQLAWFHRYNNVIDVYHKSENRENQDQQVLQKLQCSAKSYFFMSYLVNNYLMNIAMVLVYTFVPVINAGLLFLMTSYTLFVKKQTTKHKRNLSKVPDPFQAFYFYPQMCRQLQKHFTTLNLTVQQIDNFKFNQTHNKLRHSLINKQEGSSPQKNGENIENKKVKVPIYDQYFYDSFFLVRKELYKAMSWVVLGVFLISLDVLFYYGIFEDFILG